MATLYVDTSEIISRVVHVLRLKAYGVIACIASVYYTHVLSVIANVVP